MKRNFKRLFCLFLTVAMLLSISPMAFASEELADEEPAAVETEIPDVPETPEVPETPAEPETPELPDEPEPTEPAEPGEEPLPTEPPVPTDNPELPEPTEQPEDPAEPGNPEDEELEIESLPEEEEEVEPQAVTTYELNVLGAPVTSDNLEGLVDNTFHWRYDPATNVLHLEGTYTVPASAGTDFYVIWNRIPGLTIQTDYNVSLYTALDSGQNFPFIMASADTTITGGYQLSISGSGGPSCTGILVSNNSTLTLSGADVFIGRGVANGIEGSVTEQNGRLRVVNSQLNIQADTAAIVRMGGGVTLDSCSWVRPYAPVIDGGVVYQRDGATFAARVEIGTAARYELGIDGIAVTDANKNNITGQTSAIFSYDPASKTLTVNGYYEGTSVAPVIDSSIDGLTIKVAGDSTLSTQTMSQTVHGLIESSGDLTLRPGTDGVRIRLQGSGVYNRAGVQMKGASTLTVDNLDLEVDYTGYSLRGDMGGSESKLVLKKARYVSTNIQTAGIYSFTGGITLTGCNYVTPAYPEERDGSVGINTWDRDADGNTYRLVKNVQTDDEVYDLVFDGHRVWKGNRDSIVPSGFCSYNPGTKTLTVIGRYEQVSLTLDQYRIQPVIDSGIDGLTIRLLGNTEMVSYLENYNNHVPIIRSNGSLTILAASSLDTPALKLHSMTSSCSYDGIKVNNGSLTVNSIDLRIGVEGNLPYRGLSGDGSSALNLYASNAVIMSSDSAVSSFAVAPTLTGCSIAHPSPWWFINGIVCKDGSGTYAELVKVEKDPSAVTYHTVSFDVQGHGTAPAAQTVADGDTATTPADPDGGGYDFGGWYREPTCTTAYDFAAPVTGDFTLYAKWSCTEYDLWLGSARVTSANRNDILDDGTASYDPATQTLTFTTSTPNIVGVHENALIYSGSDLNIRTSEDGLKLNNPSGYGVNARTLTVNGDLIAETGSCALYAYGNITVTGNVNLTTDSNYPIITNNGTVNIGENAKIKTNSAYAINAKKDITIGGDVNVTNTHASGYGLYAPGGSISVTGGLIAETGSCALYAYGNITVTGNVNLTTNSNYPIITNNGTVNIGGNAKIRTNSAYAINAKKDITIGGDVDVTNPGGYGLYASSNSITVNGSVTGICEFSPLYAVGGNVLVTGDVDVTGTGSGSTYVIYAYKDIEIRGSANVKTTGSAEHLLYTSDGSITLNGEVDVSNANGNGMFAWKDITVNGSVTGTCRYRPLFTTKGGILVTGDVDVTSTNGGTYVINAYNDIEIRGNAKVKTTGNAEHLLYTSNGSITLNGDVDVSNANGNGMFAWKDITVNGSVTGTCKYRPLFTTNGGILVTGDVDVTSTASSTSYVIRAGQDVEIRGSANVKTTGSADYGIYASNGKVTVGSGTWDIEATQTAIFGLKGITLPRTHGITLPRGGSITKTGTYCTVTEMDDETVAKHVVIEPAYMWLGCIAVVDENKDDILEDGTASYNPDTKTLTFTTSEPNIPGVRVHTNFYDSMTNRNTYLISSYDELTVNVPAEGLVLNCSANFALSSDTGPLTVHGDIQITNDGNYGLYTGSDSITVDGDVVVNCTDGMGLFANKSITVNGNVTGTCGTQPLRAMYGSLLVNGDVNVRGLHERIDFVIGAREDVEIRGKAQISGPGFYEIYSATGSITVNGDVEMSGSIGMGLYANKNITVNGSVTGSSCTQPLIAMNGSILITGDMDVSSTYDGNLDYVIGAGEDVEIRGKAQISGSGFYVIYSNHGSIIINSDIDVNNTRGMGLYADQNITVNGSVTGTCYTQPLISGSGSIQVTGDVDVSTTLDGVDYVIGAREDVEILGSVTVSGNCHYAVFSRSGGITIGADADVTNSAGYGLFAQNGVITVASGTWDIEAGDKAICAKNGIILPPGQMITTPANGIVTLKDGYYTVTEADGATAAKHVVIEEVLEEMLPTVTLDQSYVVIASGATTAVRLYPTVTPETWAEQLEACAENEKGEVSGLIQTTLGEETVTDPESGDPVTRRYLEIRPTSAESKGTAWAVACVRVGGKLHAARCRVDVVQGDPGVIAADVAAEANGVRLKEAAATVELYRTDYTRIEVIPELTENNVSVTGLKPTDEVVLPTPVAAGGAAVTAAVFTDEETAKRFTLRVADDRVLEIVPTEQALNCEVTKELAVSSSYNSAIKVTVDGQTFTTPTKLKISVKKSMPNIKAKTVVLNSYRTGDDTQPVVYTGGTVAPGMAVVDPAKPAPGWLSYDPATGSVTYTGAPETAQKKASLMLLVQPEGWAVKRSVAVAVSAKSTAPAMTFKAKTLSLKPGTNDTAAATYTVKPALYADETPAFVRVTEGSGSTLTSYGNGEVLKVTVGSGEVSVKSTYNDGKAHTYTVALSVQGKESSFKVKTLPDSKKVTLSLSVKGAIDLAVEKSPVVITAKTANFNVNSAYISVTKIIKKGDTSETDVKGSFRIDRKENVLTLTANGVAEPGTYIVTVQAVCGGGVKAEKTANITVKESRSAPKVGVKLKAAGSIDVLRPGTAVTLTPTVTNSYTHVLRASDLTVTKTYDGAAKKKVTEDATALFIVRVKDGKYVVTAKSGAGVSHADKYTVRTAVAGVISGATALKVVQGKSKATQDVKQVSLLKTDRYSRGVVTLKLGDPTLAGIRDVKIVSPADKSKRAYFELVSLGGGEYAIQYNGSLLPANVGTLKTQTVKLQVFLEGNQTAKPNATISVKVNIK